MTTENPNVPLTDVITETDLIPNASSTSSTPFHSVIMETILVSSSSSSSPDTATEPDDETPEQLIKRYDELFKQPEEYNKFVLKKLAPWKRTLELHHFDLHYQRHRTEQYTIKRKREEAQKLLEEADRLQKGHDHLQELFYGFISTLTKQNLRRRLYKPIKIIDPPVNPRLEQRATRIYPTQPNPSPHPIVPTNQQNPNSTSNEQLNRNLSTLNRRYTGTNPYARGGSRRSSPLRCFTCQSPDHLMYFCPRYRCRHCYRLSPGPRATECPFVLQGLEEEGMYAEHPAALDDHNLTGEN